MTAYDDGEQVTMVLPFRQFHTLACVSACYYGNNCPTLKEIAFEAVDLRLPERYWAKDFHLLNPQITIQEPT